MTEYEFERMLEDSNYDVSPQCSNCEYTQNGWGCNCIARNNARADGEQTTTDDGVCKFFSVALSLLKNYR